MKYLKNFIQLNESLSENTSDVYWTRFKELYLEGLKDMYDIDADTDAKYGDGRTVSDHVDDIVKGALSSTHKVTYTGELDDAYTLIDNLIQEADPSVKRGEAKLLVKTVRKLLG